ncbi:MAG: hypothetical protein RR386_01945 [Bacteroidaceae bacterium]
MIRSFLLFLSLLFTLTLSAQEEVVSSDSLTNSEEIPQDRLLPMQSTFVNPLYYRSYNGFDGFLHSGLNASLSLSATVGLGSHSPSGVGFGKDIDVMYVFPLDKRWSAAVGLYFSDFSWGDAYSNRELGFSGTVSYRMSEKVMLSAYANKSITHTRMPLPFCPREGGDRIGGRVDVKVNDHVSFGVAIERQSHPEVLVPYWGNPFLRR